MAKRLDNVKLQIETEKNTATLGCVSHTASNDSMLDTMMAVGKLLAFSTKKMLVVKEYTVE